ncbi:NAD(P)/FAD-dependent oxidoreductase [Marisediminicola senii]|uniref:NAD(P)/FAD-dependent oxidoreductase n=1 Tax=Marisediminicola senii TaxID=2711233 RepID=UPI00191279E4|nr:FAD-dependent monooxygenase [Marisediminicola senii]
MRDVLVVGGGPAGLAAAIDASMAGLTVTIVEQRAGTIDKACGEGLMPGALPLLARLGVEPEGRPLAGVSYRASGRRVDHRFSGGPGRGVRRTTLHDALTRRVDELGIERVEAKVGAVTQTTDAVTTGSGLDARYLLACDGLHSSVARELGLAMPAIRRGRRFGLRQHHAVAPWSHLIEVHYTRDAELYVTPVADDTVGIAVLGPQHTDFDAVVAAVPELADRLAGTELSSPRRGAGPFRQRTSARTRGRVLLVGDASGYVDAITGEGLRLGFAQASGAVRSIVAGRPGDYEAEWHRATRDFRVLTGGLVALAQSPLRGAIVPAAERLPRVFGAIVERLAR